MSEFLRRTPSRAGVPSVYIKTSGYKKDFRILEIIQHSDSGLLGNDFRRISHQKLKKIDR